MRVFFRKLHRWLGLLMALQIIAWMASGLYFSIFPIKEIRGEHLTRERTAPDAELLFRMGSPATVKGTMDRHFGAGWQLEDVRLLSRDGHLFWRVEGRVGDLVFTRLLNESGNKVMPELTPTQARQTAENWLVDAMEPQSVELLESVEAGAEYRGRILPVWKVSFGDSDSLSLYLDPWTGELLARRTNRWRVFDFLWMLHIMDFEDRENFNQPLLQVSALLGLIIALSGVIFWAIITPVFRKKRVV